jgi:RNA polymerase sigma-70 factor, ECF subfamily
MHDSGFGLSGTFLVSLARRGTMSEASVDTIDRQNLFEQNSGEYYTYLFRQALRITRNRDDAEEITQTAFVQFLEQMQRKNWTFEVKSVRAYLRKAADNLCKDMWKRRAKEKSVSYDDEHVREALELQAAETDDSVARMENRIYYRQLYATLPNVIMGGSSPYEQQLLQLRRIDGLSLKEIAPIVGKDVCQIRYDLQKVEARIRHRVRKIMDEKVDGTP